MISIKTAAELVDHLFWPTFIERDDCVFLSWSCPQRVEFDSALPDRTAVEALHNHVHVLDRFRHSASIPDEPFYDVSQPDFECACQLGRAMAQMWRAALTQQFPDRRFLVYFAVEQDPIVRFHGIHAGEQPWLRPCDFRELLGRDALLVLEAPATLGHDA
jgi:hypothetical protein